jgi:hypothetical protein
MCGSLNSGIKKNRRMISAFLQALLSLMIDNFFSSVFTLFFLSSRHTQHFWHCHDLDGLGWTREARVGMKDDDIE